MPSPIGLFLDGGSRIGWAVMPYDHVPAILARGTFKTASAGRGAWGWRLHLIDRWLDGMVLKHRPNRIGFEAPYQGERDPIASRLLACIAGKFEEVAARRGLECSEVAPATAKVALAGSGRAKKPDMIAHARHRFDIECDEHQADAIAVGLVCIDNYFRELFA